MALTKDDLPENQKAMQESMKAMKEILNTIRESQLRVENEWFPRIDAALEALQAMQTS